MKQNYFRRQATLVRIKFQKGFRIRPRNFCLITGAPRSGTTAVRRWLRGQKGVVAFNESRILVSIHGFLEDIQRFRTLKHDEEALLNLARQLVYNYYANSKILLGRNLLVDKEPLEPTAFPNMEYDKFLENTRKLLPEAKFLLMIRDPVATVWSMTQRKWGVSLSNEEPRTMSLDEHIKTWICCAELVLQNFKDSNTYVCQFGRLVADPMNESNRILGFLGIRQGEAFRPQVTREIGFSYSERERILTKTKAQLEMLSAKGISDL